MFATCHNQFVTVRDNLARNSEYTATSAQLYAPTPAGDIARCPIAIGVMAYNEESNIIPLLESILAQDAADRITRLIVIASGCTDRTCDLVDAFSEREPRVELVVEGKRAGKIAAINTFLRRVIEPVVLVSCGDLVFESGSLEAMVAPLADPTVGMTGGHPVPVNSDERFVGFAVNLMWKLHDRIARVQPKMGELVAFRNVFGELDVAALCDELSIEKKIRDEGYSIVYAPDAHIRNKGPETLREFVRQRIRWNAANYQIVSDHAMEVSTLRPERVLAALRELIVEERPSLLRVAAVAAVELYCKARAYLDYYVIRTHHKHRVWTPLASTKTLDTPSKL
jgi:cellulose synthase/poly-beta-1,6-N-acetylglucosamine synthase-like glycosyltransferase